MGVLFNPFSGTFDFTGGGGGTLSYLTTSFTAQTSVTVTHNFGDYPVVAVIDNTGAVIIPLTITHASVNAFTVTFTGSTTGNIISTLGAPNTGPAVSFGLPFGLRGSISTGIYKKVTVPYNATITRVTLLAKEAAGSMVLDILKNGVSICAAAKPTLTAANEYDDATLTGWDVDIVAGDQISYEVESISGITEFDNMLWVDKI